MCNVFMIHKKDFGMVVCYRLFKDIEQMNNLKQDKDLINNVYNITFYRPKPPYPIHTKGYNRIIEHRNAINGK